MSCKDDEKSAQIGSSPVAAFSKGEVDTVRLLCERGADVNGTEGWGNSYLWSVQCAIERDGPESKQAEIGRILLSFGAKVIQEEPKLTWDEQLGRNVRIDSGKLV